MADEAAAAARRKQQREMETAIMRRRSAEKYWYPNKDKSYKRAADAGSYHADDPWRNQDITSVPPMCYTDRSAPFICARDGLQIYSIEIASIRGGLRWPLDVFGMVVARDVLEIDRTRNIIFARARSNCQTISEERPYLELTGPTRGVVTCIDPGNIEIMLKVKGATESEDRDLSFLALVLKSSMYCSYDRDCISKRSTQKLTFRHIDDSLEATISVKLVDGSSWPVGFQGVFTASIASIDDAEAVLLSFGDDKLPVVADDGTIELSRRVVSVEHRGGELKVSVVARCGKEEHVARRDDIVFKSKYAGRSCGVLNVGTCKMQVTVAWSLFH